MVATLSDNALWELALGRIGRKFSVRRRFDQLEVVEPGSDLGREDGDGEVVAEVPALRLENLGDVGFTAEHGLRYPCMSGAMANGIGSVEIVEAMGRAGFLGSFGAAGLAPAVVERAIARIQGEMGGHTPYAINLIHSPAEPLLEASIVDLFLRRIVMRNDERLQVLVLGQSFERLHPFAIQIAKRQVDRFDTIGNRRIDDDGCDIVRDDAVH